MHRYTNRSTVRNLAVLAFAAAGTFAVALPSNPLSAAASAPTVGSPAEFSLDLTNNGLPFLIGSYNTASGYQNYQIMNIEGTTTSDADAGYPGHDLVRDFQGDPSDWWFAPNGYGDQGEDLQGFMYDAAAPADSKYAYFVLEQSNTGNSPSHIGRVDNNGVFAHVAHVDRTSGVLHAEHEWTMLSSGDLILFESTTGKLLNFGNLRSLTDEYTPDTKGQSPTLTPQSETAVGQEMPATTFSDNGLPGLLQTAVVDIAGVEHVMVIDSDSLPSVGIHLFNAATLAYVGELDPSASTGLEGEPNFWTTTSSPAVEATASIGGDAYLVYSTPETVLSYSSVFADYALGKIAADQIDLNTMTVTITSHLTDVEMRNRVSLGIQAPAAAQTLNLPPALPAISYLVYDENGGQAGTAPSAHTDETSTVVAVESGIPTYDGFNFTGWNTAADGTGTSYGAGDSYTLPGDAGAADSVYAQWAPAPGTTSCSSSPTGFIQAIKGLEGDDIVSFKLLDLEVGDYVDMDPAVSLDLAALGFGGAGGFNATAIDKATGKIFATINDGEDVWLVQFDVEPTPNVAFLGKVRRPDTQGGFSGTVTSDGTYVMNYYITGLVEIPNVSSLTTYGSPEAASGVLLGTVHETDVFGWHGDLASITLSDNSEHVVGYNPATNKVVLAPVDDLSNPVAYTTTFPSSFATSGENLGASWSTGDTVYFSRNDGEGVFAVSADDIDVNAQELIMRATSVTSTVSTSSNDGFGCVPADEAPEVVQLPDQLGGLHGWMWADIDGDGSRTAVEPTSGMFGDEAAITGYSATVVSETDWTTLQGVVTVPAGTRYPATVDADGKWSVDGLAAGADPTGVVQTFKVEFDYTGATMPADFTPAGYTVKGGSTGTDSDVPVTAGATATSIGGFTVSADSSSHGADAGITTPLPELPVVFEEQGGSEVGDLTCELGGSFTVPAAPTRDGYTFAGWNSAADGTGTAYTVGSTVDCADLTIYATWTQNPVDPPVNPPVVTFEEEGGTEVDDPVCTSGGSFVVPAAPTRDGFTFAGWNSAADGSGASYVVGASVDCADLTIYATWTQNPVDPPVNPPVVTFEEEGGTEVVDPVCTAGGSFVVPAAPTRDGFTFAGWNSAADGTGTAYTVGSTVDCADLTIYATWTQELIELPATGQDETRIQLAVLVAALGAFLLLLTGQRRKELPTIRER